MANYFDHCMTHEQLEQEHRKLVIKMHPDRNSDNPNATADFQEMQEQYEERKAELNGDYTKARKGRERREREERERKERERKEQERRKVETAIIQARENRQKNHVDLMAGDYIFARGVEWMNSFSADECCTNDVLHMAVKQGVKDECVVKIEVVFHVSDKELLDGYLVHAMNGGIYGGYEVLQRANPAEGIRKGRRVAKVVMFRSERYCIFGNPMGDRTIEDYYLPVNYETMFSDHLHRIKASIERVRLEEERKAAERKARILAEQTPLIEEWRDKLIEVSAGLSFKEQNTVAASNFKTMLKSKFPGTKFSVKENRYGEVIVRWEDGPTRKEVFKVMDLFDSWSQDLTPWMECYGKINFALGELERKMSVLTKAKILQQLGSVTEAFRKGQMYDEFKVSDFDWMMLHLLVGIKVEDFDAELCHSTMHPDGKRSVKIANAVRFVFDNSSYVKPKANRKKAA